MNVQLPEINLNGIIPTLALALIAAVCIVALLVRSLLHSRVALLIAVVGGVILAGPTLALALERMVGALVPLGVVLIIGGVTTLWLLQRNPELMSLVREALPGRSPLVTPPPSTIGENGNGSASTVIDQPGTPRQTVQTARSMQTKPDADRWGF